MNNLPDTKSFKDHKLKLKEKKYFSDTPKQTNYDLNKLHMNYKKAHEEQKEKVLNHLVIDLPDDMVNVTTLLYKLFDRDFIRSVSNGRKQEIFNKYIGYSRKDKSLTISLIDGDHDVKTIVTRSSMSKDGTEIKWKTYGSKKYMPYKIKDDFIFLGVGMAEFILFELLDVSYLSIQADSMHSFIKDEVIAKIKGKNLIILKENDASFEKLIVKLIEIFKDSSIYIIDFEKVLNRKLPKGFDFRDLINEIKNAAVVEQLIENEILKQIKNKREEDV